MTVDQSYSLGEALLAYARPEDLATQADFIERWQTREAEVKAACKAFENEIDQAHLDDRLDDERRFRQRLDSERKALWGALLKEFGGVSARPAPMGKVYASLHPATWGLLDALYKRAAVAYGRVGGLQCPKVEVPANIWNGLWEFQTQANLARGGTPFVEIFGLRILPAQSERQAEIKSVITRWEDNLPARPLSAADRRELTKNILPQLASPSSPTSASEGAHCVSGARNNHREPVAHTPARDGRCIGAA